MPEPAFLPSDSLTVGQKPLAVLAQGTFPTITFAQNDSGQVTRTLSYPPNKTAGALILLGSSEMFKNDYLYAPGFQHEQLILNTVAYLTRGNEYTEIQARRKISRGFQHLPAYQKAFWRIVVVSTGTLIFLLYGLMRFIRQRQTP
jgi:hypothetical protein